MNINLVITNDTPVIESHQNVLMSELNSIPPRGCKSLILNHVLNYLTDEQIQEVLAKIRHGGSISVTCPDVMEAASALHTGTIDMALFSTLTSNRLKQYSLLDAKSLFEQQGYAIETAVIQDLSFYIKANRS